MRAASTVPEGVPTAPYAGGMSRLQADADPTLWVPVTQSLGFRGRRHRKAAIRMLLTQANSALGAAERPGSGVAAWAMSQAAPFLMKRAAGRVLVWVWKADAELVVVMAQLQQATNDLRAARAMMPMEYDDTESFRNPHLGVGEKLEMPLPSDGRTPPFATYTWDTGSHFVTVTAVCSDRERFGTVIGSVDDLARTVRVVEDLTTQESAEVLRIDPA
ncbi:hypothetical protein GCM10010460_11720 [Microbacterium terrae]|uniref:Uncharacterized protein n=2 Tax=Microbacterium terrae TaxID=69369 RepID=A0A0M2H282_9MICO|nr:hypothetical protein RS81_01606 [Microbacterium terrae]